MAFGDIARADVEPRLDGSGQGRFPHSGVAGQQGRVSLQQFPHGLDAGAVERRKLEDGVPGAFIGGFECGYGFGILCRQVGFGQQNRDGYAVGLAGYQEAVDELRSRHGREQRHDQQRPVEVGGDDVRLFGEVRGPANDVVAARHYFADDSGVLFVPFADDPVAHDYGVGRTYAFQTQASPDTALDRFPGVRADVVPAARRADYRSGELSLHNSCSSIDTCSLAHSSSGKSESARRIIGR